MHMLDTNVCIDFIAGRSDILRGRMRAVPADSLCMSTITCAELLVGSRSSAGSPEAHRRLADFVRLIPAIPFDQPAAEVYGRIARANGYQRHSFDRLIAAHAIARHATLVTSNVRDFSAFPTLKVENWTLPL